MVVSTITHVDSNEDNANQSSSTTSYSVDSSSSSRDVMFGKTALSHNESITTFLSCSHIRRRRVTTNEDVEFENMDNTMPTRIRRVVVEMDEASRTSVRASEATRLVRLLLERESDFDWSGLSFKSLFDHILSHLRRGLDNVRVFVVISDEKDDDVVLTNAIVASNILNGFAEPLRVGGSIVRRDEVLHRDDKGTLLHINDDDTLSVMWSSSSPPRIESARVHTVRAVSATDAPLCFVRHLFVRSCNTQKKFRSFTHK